MTALGNSSNNVCVCVFWSDTVCDSASPRMMEGFSGFNGGGAASSFLSYREDLRFRIFQKVSGGGFKHRKTRLCVSVVHVSPLIMECRCVWIRVWSF